MTNQRCELFVLHFHVELVNLSSQDNEFIEHDHLMQNFEGIKTNDCPQTARRQLWDLCYILWCYVHVTLFKWVTRVFVFDDIINKNVIVNYYSNNVKRIQHTIQIIKPQALPGQFLPPKLFFLLLKSVWRVNQTRWEVAFIVIFLTRAFSYFQYLVSWPRT